MKRAGDEHRAEHQRDGDDRPGDLAHRLDRRRAGVHALRHPPLDVLEHHDGVVHHDADGQHQAEQRQVVQAEPGDEHDRERAGQGDRHVDHGQDHRPPVLEEQQHDDRDEDDGVAERVERPRPPTADERAWCRTGSAYARPLGNRLSSSAIVDFTFSAVSSAFDAGQLEDRQPRRRLAAEGVADVLALGGQLDALEQPPAGVAAVAADHVLEADHRAGTGRGARGHRVRVGGRVGGGGGRRRRRRGRGRALVRRVAGLDHDVAELLDVGQPAQRADRVLERLAGRGRLLADLPGRHLHVLLLDGLDHVARRTGRWPGACPGRARPACCSPAGRAWSRRRRRRAGPSSSRSWMVA